jgi:superfamily I DNA and/or RNA helicase
MYASAKKDFQLPVQDISSLCSLVDENQNVGKELIIFTGCHHNKDGRIGRLSDLRRLNSFLCRGRRGIIVVGDLETFGRNPTWNNLINWALKNRLVLQLE